MRANIVCFNNNIILGEDLAPQKLRLLSVLRMMVLFVILCASHYMWRFGVGLCFGVHYFMSFLVLQST